MRSIELNSKTLKILLLVILVTLGFYTKYYTGPGHEFVHNYLGGIIYVIFWIIFFSTLIPKATPFKVTVWVFLVTSLIEFTQIIHTPFLDHLREYILFRALFGSTFNPFDFIGYFAGAVIGFSMQVIVSKRNNT